MRFLHRARSAACERRCDSYRFLRHDPAPDECDPDSGPRRPGARMEVIRPVVPCLQFLGATGTVTGSRFLLDTPQARVLVDCGLFQGLKSLRLRNWAGFPVAPSSDRCRGSDTRACRPLRISSTSLARRLPRPDLRNSGDTCSVSDRPSGQRASPGRGRELRESQGFLEAYARSASLHGRRCLPRTREFQRGVLSHTRRSRPGRRRVFRPAGHILGSAAVEFALAGPPSQRILVSGDLGRPSHPILRPPEPPAEADVVLIESTYGDRRHPRSLPIPPSRRVIVRTAARGGTVVIPAFAVDRTEVILLALRRLMREGRVPEFPVYVDSPMALSALAIYRTALSQGAPDVRPDFEGDGDPFDTGRTWWRPARLSSRRRSMSTSLRQSLSLPPAWRPVGASCITLPTFFPIRAIPSCCQVSKPRGHADDLCLKVRARSRSTAATSRSAQRCSGSLCSPYTRTRRNSWRGCVLCQARPIRLLLYTERPRPRRHCANASTRISGGRRLCPVISSVCDWAE